MCQILRNIDQFIESASDNNLCSNTLIRYCLSRVRGVTPEAVIVRAIQLTKTMVLGAMLAMCACASSVSASQGNLRYDSWIDERGIIYRFDRQSGEIEQLVKMPSGPPMWTTVPTISQNTKGVAHTQAQAPVLPILTDKQVVQQERQQQNYQIPPITAPQPTSQNTPSKTQLIDPQNIDFSSYKGEPVIHKTSNRIKLFDEKDNDITDEINDAERAANRGLIASYERSLSVIATVGIGERTTGMVSVTNNGTKKIRVMEVTVSALKAGGSGKAEVLERILFCDKPGCEKPPAPAEFGSNKGGMAGKRIDLATPPSATAAKSDVKITYIKFDE